MQTSVRLKKLLMVSSRQREALLTQTLRSAQSRRRERCTLETVYDHSSLAAWVRSVLPDWQVLTPPVFGRHLVAIGTNAEAVRMAGIRTAPVSVAVFAISGLLSGLAGWSMTARLSTADPNGGVGIELAAIAACVIGGTSLMGGKGSVVSTFLGVLIIQVLQTGLAQLGVSDANKQIVTGGVIIAAVLLDAFRREKRS